MLEKVLFFVGFVFFIGAGLSAQGIYYIVPSLMSLWNSDPDGRSFDAFRGYAEAWAMTKEPVK